MLLVTRVFPFAEASGDKPPFARASGDEPPFARASGDEPPFARASGDEPPRRQAATPPLDEELRLRRDGGSPIRRKGGQVAAGTHQVPSVGRVFVLLGGELGLTMDVVVQQLL